MAGAGITSYAGGSAGHDPVRVAALAKERGLTPNVHLTCVSKTPTDVAKFLDDLIALDIENAFAITGDYPKGAPLGTEALSSARAALAGRGLAIQLVALGGVDGESSAACFAAGADAVAAIRADLGRVLNARIRSGAGPAS